MLPAVHPVAFDFSRTGYVLCIVDTGGNHADLTAEYAAIPAEMQEVAKYFGKDVLAEVPSAQVLRSIPELRKAFGDRAVLRAMHFYREDGRAQGESDALDRGDFEAFLHLVQNSGQSSYCLLQNVYPSSAPEDQPISIALAVGSAVLGGSDPCTRRRFRRNSTGICAGCAAVPVSGGYGICSGKGLLPRAANSFRWRHDCIDIRQHCAFVQCC